MTIRIPDIANVVLFPHSLVKLGIELMLKPGCDHLLPGQCYFFENFCEKAFQIAYHRLL